MDPKPQRLVSFRVSKYVAAIFGVLILVSVLLVVYNAKLAKPSRECLQIREEVFASLKVGDKEERLVQFLVKRGWEYAHDAPLGIYSVQLETKKSWSGESHLIKVNFEAKNGQVESIHVVDFYRTL